MITQNDIDEFEVDMEKVLVCGGRDFKDYEKVKAAKTQRRINMRMFPKGFFNHPVHLQHCHKTDMTEGAVHAQCNAIMWQYEGR